MHLYNIKVVGRIIPYRIRLLFLVTACMLVITGCSHQPENALVVNAVPKIFPEYYDLTIPPNIAPLNFVIKEPGSKFRVEISAGESKKILIRQRSPIIKIPRGAWRKMLSGNAGENLTLDILTFHNNKWNRFTRINHKIATDPIDPYLAYRLVYTVYLKWYDMGIYQRNLTGFRERPVIVNSSTEHSCINCHTFERNDPSRMLIHFRILHPGTLIWNKGRLSKVDTRTPNTPSPGVYPSWHPDGKHIAFSVGKISPRLTTRLNKPVDVADWASDLILYDTEKNTVSTSPEISTDRRENMPAWSPDGKYLYFISAPEAKKGDVESLLHAKYSLMRIAYDAALDTWGQAEMILSSDVTGMSISKPSVSPDGKYLVCSMSDYGYFTIFHKGSDLYSVNLETREYKKLELNSSSAESHSCWSSNGRWLVFSSKRMDGVLTRPYIAYFDTNGVAHTPFVLPQQNPEMYDRLLANFNLPELLTGKISLTPVEIRDIVFKDPQKSEFEK